MRFKKILTALALSLLAVTLSTAQQTEKLRVLFIGNSLTYTNDLPAIVAALAKSSRQRSFEYKTVAFPDFSLEDHWNQGDANREIAKAKWDFVVLQQGPSSLPESRVLLREYVRKFAEEIKRAQAKPAVYMVWPSVARQRDFERVIESHRLAVIDVDAVSLPVGAAWFAAFKSNPKLPLYSSDNFHPSELGSFLSAWVIFKQLYRNQTTQMPNQLNVGSKKIELSPSQLTVLSAAANDALKE